jgi:hypothetical protein
MKERSWLEFELRRVLNLAQSAPCLKRKEGRKIGLLPYEVDF